MWKNSQYYERPFHRLIKRFGPEATLMVYRTGVVVCLANSLEKGKQRIRNLAWSVQKMGINVRLGAIRIENIVGTNRLNKDFDLNELDQHLDTQSQYNKEIFPNLRFTSSENSKAKIILSTSGKYTLTGVKSVDAMCALEEEFLGKVQPILHLVTFSD